ncbi:MAG: hypothetical protein KOO60_03135 [Gemmatimonadales bacterium]|nr:hypothetical protein [Gemmatimonadales bacterium]
MSPSKDSKQSVSGQENVFYGPTLKEAYRQVENRYGRDVIILGSRKITRRQETGLGQEHLVEVTVQPPGDKSVRVGPGSAVAPLGYAPTTPAVAEPDASATSPEILREIELEVERIEKLVIEASESKNRDVKHDELEGNPLAQTLLTAGAGKAAVRNLLTRFAGETGRMMEERPAALAWLNENLKASNCGWDGFFGCHAFLGDAGSGRTRMVLGAAAELKKQGRKTLVLSLHPGHAGEIRRLQNAAAKLGFDAGIIRKDSQLAKSEKHLGKYEAVLLDLPALDHPSLALGDTIHSWLSKNHSFHRHLVVPLDRDFQDLEELNGAARAWNCDWIALSRMDRTRLQGKILDLAESIPLPYSLRSENRGIEELLNIAASGELLDRILIAGSARLETEFVPDRIAGMEIAD